MTDRDDALRKELGWTGPEESNYEPDTGPSERREASPPTPPAPRRPPVEFEPSRTDSSAASAPPDEPKPFSTGPNRVPPETAAPAPAQDAGARGGGPGDTPPPAFREPERPGGSFRQPPPQYSGQPPAPPRDASPSANATRTDASAWSAPQGWQPPRQARPPQPPAPSPPGARGPQQWPAPGYGGDAPTPPQPGSYAERIRADDLVPSRKTPPGRGWRLALYKASFGLINLGQSPEEIREAELVNKIKSVLRGHYKVGVMGKGGVGKTTVSASIGSVFAELRQDDRVVAIDADTAFGKLGSRVDPRAQGSYWELASDHHLETFADVRSRVGNNAAGLFVLAGEATPARRRVLDPAIYREATSRLDRYFTISIIDCSSTMDSPVTQEVLRDLDALIVVSSPWVDGAAAAGQTLDWLANRGLTRLLQRTVIVLNDSDGHADKRTRSILAQQFSSQGQAVIEVPFDGHLRPGGVIDGTSEMSQPTRQRFVEIAAALAEHFPKHDDRSRERERF